MAWWDCWVSWEAACKSLLAFLPPWNIPVSTTKMKSMTFFRDNGKRTTSFQYFGQSGITEVYRAPDWRQMDAASPFWSHSQLYTPTTFPALLCPSRWITQTAKSAEKLHRKKRKWKDKVLSSINKLNQSMQEALKMSTRSKRPETKDGREDKVKETEAFYLPRIIRSAQLYCLH